jgi:ribonuclease BN (tRNA processing enzyme)
MAVDHPALRVTFLGTGDAFASGGRSHACVLLETDRDRLLVDCGAAAPVALRRHEVPPSTINGVVLTHLHGDHAGGVPFLLLDAVYNEPRSARLTVAGPRGTEERTLGLTNLLYPGVADKARRVIDLQFVELGTSIRVPIGPFAVTPFAAVHGSEAAGFMLRLEIAGRTLAFSGDTEWTPELIDVSRDADLFVCECTSYDGAVPGHLSHAQLAEHRDELTARRTLLTHLGPDALARRDRLSFEVADDGMVVGL